jgi:hypothetical protein
MGAGGLGGVGGSPIIMAEQLKRAGSPLAHARARKPPAPKDVQEGPQRMARMQREGGTAKGAAGVQKSQAALKQINEARNDAAALVRFSAVGGVSIVLDVVPTQLHGVSTGEGSAGLGPVLLLAANVHFRSLPRGSL